jgi:hypothetical protein
MYWIQVGHDGIEFVLTQFDAQTSTAVWTPLREMTSEEDHQKATYLYNSLPLHTVIMHLRFLPTTADDTLAQPTLRRQQAGSRFENIFLEGHNKIHSIY